MYIPLVNHSAYSLQEGLIQPKDLAVAAQKAGYPAIGLTDHRLLTGSVEFVRECSKLGIQPVLGLEIDLENSPLILFAMSIAGWSSLCSISSGIALSADPTGACPFELIESNSKDLLAIAVPPQKTSGFHIQALKEVFTDRLYLGLQEPSNVFHLSYISRRLAIPLVAYHPVYYLEPKQKVLQQTLTAIRLNIPLNQIPDDAKIKSDSYLCGPDDMDRRFLAARSAIKATEEIAQRCKFDLPLGASRMPVISLPPGVTATQALRHKAESGAINLYGKISPTIRIRLDHELEVIAQMGFEPIFLIVEDIINYARINNVPFSSRGSAASSLVAHCLGITSPDPLRLDLYFERFLNPARTIPPDIDTDLCSRRRDRIIKHVIDMYGEKRVAMVGTINRFRPRSALNDVAKAHGLSKIHIHELSENLPHSFFSHAQELDQKTGRPKSHFSDIRKMYPASSFQKIFDEAESLLKLPRHLSVHAGGLVVSPEELTKIVPVMRSGSKGIIITQMDLESVEALGLVKIDLLGIRGLTVLGDVAEFIQVNHTNQYTGLIDVLESTPANDPATSDRLENGETIGCFQIESPGMRATLREIHARTQDDLMAALALYRPGPLSGGLKDAFVRRFKGEEPVEHIHPSLAHLLGDTYGVILYQEQVLRIVHELAGFTLAEADLLRRAMSHFDPGKRMQELKRKFVDNAAGLHNIPAETGERLWEMMAAFAGYGFPKAHAASYAQIGWRSAWCKTHFPAEFMAAVLANWGGYYNQRVYLGEARRLGLSVHPPNVNFSNRNFITVDNLDGKKELFMGLDQVRDLTKKTISRILQSQPFSSLDDFLLRTDPRPQEAENLAKIGAFKEFGTIPSILRRINRGWHAGQPSLFNLNQETSASTSEDWNTKQKTAAQIQLLGISLETNPLDFLTDKLVKSGSISTIEAAGKVGKSVIVAGMKQTGHRSRTSKGELMMFFTLEDSSGLLEVVVFPNVFRASRYILNSQQPLIVSGTVTRNEERGEPFLVAEKISPIS